MAIIEKLQFAIADVVDDFPQEVTIRDVVDTLRNLADIIVDHQDLLKELQEKRKRIN